MEQEQEKKYEGNTILNFFGGLDSDKMLIIDWQLRRCCHMVDPWVSEKDSGLPWECMSTGMPAWHWQWINAYTEVVEELWSVEASSDHWVLQHIEVDIDNNEALMDVGYIVRAGSRY